MTFLGPHFWRLLPYLAPFLSLQMRFVMRTPLRMLPCCHALRKRHSLIEQE